MIPTKYMYVNSLLKRAVLTPLQMFMRYFPPLLQSGRYMVELAGKIYVAMDKSVYLLSAVPLKDQVYTCIYN